MKNYNYKKRIISKKNCVSVIGLGYVGLPLSLLISKKDKVIGIDIDKKKISTLNSNISYLERIDNSKIRRFNKKKNFFVQISQN